MLKNIKTIIKMIVHIIIILIFNKITRRIISSFKVICNLLYSYYVGAELKKIDQSYMLEYPFILKGGKYIVVGKRFSTRARFRIEAWDYYYGIKYNPQIIIGDNVVCNFDCHIGAINKISIGNNVLIGSRVLITDHNHGEITRNELEIAPYLRPLFSKGPVIIENNVWIGEGVAILPNVTIGENSIIGANSVVNVDIPKNCVAGGVPVRILKQF